jgi:hypothetical protein
MVGESLVLASIPVDSVNNPRAAKSVRTAQHFTDRADGNPL